VRESERVRESWRERGRERERESERGNDEQKLGCFAMVVPLRI